MFKEFLTRKIYGSTSFNILRLIETVLCAICFALALFIFHKSLIGDLVGLIVLFAVCSTFLFVCVVDIVSISLLWPIRWTPWLLISTTAVLTFFLCAGILFGHIMRSYWLLPVIAGAFNAITALVFLIDMALLTWLVATYRISYERTAGTMRSSSKMMCLCTGSGDYTSRASMTDSKASRTQMQSQQTDQLSSDKKTSLSDEEGSISSRSPPKKPSERKGCMPRRSRSAPRNRIVPESRSGEISMSGETCRSEEICRSCGEVVGKDGVCPSCGQQNRGERARASSSRSAETVRSSQPSSPAEKKRAAPTAKSCRCKKSKRPASGGSEPTSTMKTPGERGADHYYHIKAHLRHGDDVDQLRSRSTSRERKTATESQSDRESDKRGRKVADTDTKPRPCVTKEDNKKKATEQRGHRKPNKKCSRCNKGDKKKEAESRSDSEADSKARPCVTKEDDKKVTEQREIDKRCSTCHKGDKKKAVETRSESETDSKAPPCVTKEDTKKKATEQRETDKRCSTCHKGGKKATETRSDSEVDRRPQPCASKEDTKKKKAAEPQIDKTCPEADSQPCVIKEDSKKKKVAKPCSDSKADSKPRPCVVKEDSKKKKATEQRDDREPPCLKGDKKKAAESRSDSEPDSKPRPCITKEDKKKATKQRDDEPPCRKVDKKKAAESRSDSEADSKPSPCITKEDKKKTKKKRDDEPPCRKVDKKKVAKPCSDSEPDSKPRPCGTKEDRKKKKVESRSDSEADRRTRPCEGKEDERKPCCSCDRDDKGKKKVAESRSDYDTESRLSFAGTEEKTTTKKKAKESRSDRKCFPGRKKKKKAAESASEIDSDTSFHPCKEAKKKKKEEEPCSDPAPVEDCRQYKETKKRPSCGEVAQKEAVDSKCTIEPAEKPSCQKVECVTEDAPPPEAPVTKRTSFLDEKVASKALLPRRSCLERHSATSQSSRPSKEHDEKPKRKSDTENNGEPVERRTSINYRDGVKSQSAERSMLEETVTEKEITSQYRYVETVKKRTFAAASHGGTFHVSKEVAPIVSKEDSQPQVIRPIRYSGMACSQSPPTRKLSIMAEYVSKGTAQPPQAEGTQEKRRSSAIEPQKDASLDRKRSSALEAQKDRTPERKSSSASPPAKGPRRWSQAFASPHGSPPCKVDRLSQSTTDNTSKAEVKRHSKEDGTSSRRQSTGRDSGEMRLSKCSQAKGSVSGESAIAEGRYSTGWESDEKRVSRSSQAKRSLSGDSTTAERRYSRSSDARRSSSKEPDARSRRTSKSSETRRSLPKEAEAEAEHRRTSKYSEAGSQVTKESDDVERRVSRVSKSSEARGSLSREPEGRERRTSRNSEDRERRASRNSEDRERRASRNSEDRERRASRNSKQIWSVLDESETAERRLSKYSEAGSQVMKESDPSERRVSKSSDARRSSSREPECRERRTSRNSEGRERRFSKYSEAEAELLEEPGSMRLSDRRISWSETGRHISEEPEAAERTPSIEDADNLSEKVQCNVITLKTQRRSKQIRDSVEGSVAQGRKSYKEYTFQDVPCEPGTPIHDCMPVRCGCRSCVEAAKAVREQAAKLRNQIEVVLPGAADRSPVGKRRLSGHRSPTVIDTSEEEAVINYVPMKAPKSDRQRESSETD